MRYLINRQTDELRLIDDNDDNAFYELLAQRDDDRRQIWVQTGPQDPRVQALELPGQNPANRTAGDELKSLNVEQLHARAAELGIAVEGTGKDGRVLRSDLERALSAPTNA